MNVFLVPVAPDRYELCCEEHDDSSAEPPPKGFSGRMLHRLRERLTAMGKEGGVKARAARWIAESIEEQRLLWQLRGRSDAELVYPGNLTEAQAMQLLRRSLSRDWERHRFWLIVDTLGGLASVPLTLVPGPNVIGYYFLFRIVGHYLSLRGARQGLTRIAWTLQPAPDGPQPCKLPS